VVYTYIHIHTYVHIYIYVCIGASLRLFSGFSYVTSNGTASCRFKEGYYFYCYYYYYYGGGIYEGDIITSIIDNRSGKLKMNFLKNTRLIPHVIVNIPSEGVYVGVFYLNVLFIYSYCCSFTVF
jgi:hypothetical protein